MMPVAGQAHQAKAGGQDSNGGTQQGRPVLLPGGF